MAGRRPLTQSEERQLLRLVRKLHPRNRALITTQWFTGFRIHEILSLTVASVLRSGAIVSQIGITPRFLKGNYGCTRWVPVLPELHRALTRQLWWLDRKFGLRPDLTLFPSRKRCRGGVVRAICRTQAHDIVKATFHQAGIEDDGRLGTHSLRKTFARNVYKHSGNDLMVLKAALHHSDVDMRAHQCLHRGSFSQAPMRFSNHRGVHGRPHPIPRTPIYNPPSLPKQRRQAGLAVLPIPCRCGNYSYAVKEETIVSRIRLPEFRKISYRLITIHAHCVRMRSL
jgi:hypothetical protein